MNDRNKRRKIMSIILLALVAVVAILAGIAVYWRVRAMRNTDATTKFTGKIPGKVAIVYYSQSKVGNTEIAAKWIQKHTGGDLIAIECAEPYPDAYYSTLKAAGAERKSGKYRPIKPLPSLDRYDVIFIGSPIWYGTYAFPVAEFLKEHKLAGKIVVPFSTHGGGGSANYERDIKAACPEATVLPGWTARGSNQLERRMKIGVTGHHTEDDVVTWLNRIFPRGSED